MRLIDSFENFLDRELELWLRLAKPIRPPIAERRGLRFTLSLEFLLNAESRTYIAKASASGYYVSEVDVECTIDDALEVLSKKMRDAATGAIDNLAASVPGLAEDLLFASAETLVVEACGVIYVSNRSAGQHRHAYTLNDWVWDRR